ncbi:MAG: Gfo/Idh/MocA family oxidoreductase [Pirellulaceae bacterium]
MLNVGIAGIGFMGWIHYLAYQRVRGVKLAALCTRDAKKRSGDWRGIQGNFGPPGEQVDLAGVATYEQYREMLSDPKIDVVDICLPPDLHAMATLEALKAGKHVFCEKPLALTAAECSKMVAAAKKVRRLLLVGHVLPFFPEYAHARKLIDSGKYGKLLGGSFKRVISDPLWLKDFYDPQKVGGPLVDLHVHDAHLIRMLFGMPNRVVSQGRMRGDVVDFCESLFGFEDASLVVRATSGVINQQGRPFTHAFEIYLEKATLNYELGAFADNVELMPLKVLTDKGKVLRPELGGGDEITAFEGEIKEVVRSIKSGAASNILSAELARDAIVLCHKQSESIKNGKPVRV